MWKVRAAAGVLSLLCVAPTERASAQAVNVEPFELHVQRDEPAASCPDEAWLAPRVAAHIAGAATAGRFEVVFTKQGAEWQARIVRWEAADSAPAERDLHDASAGCEPLAEAVALTVALLADDAAAEAEAPAPVQSEPEAPAAPPIAAPPSDPVQREDAGDARSVRLWLGVAAGGAVAFIAPVAPLAGGGLALDVGAFRAGLRVMLTTEQSFELEPGRVMVQAWLATALGCFANAGKAAGFALCAALDGAALRGSASGFEGADPRTRPYVAAGLEAQPSLSLGRSWRLTAVLGASWPLYQESFSVTGRGVAYRPPMINVRVLASLEVATF